MMSRRVIPQLKGEEWPRPFRPPVRNSISLSTFNYIYSIAVNKSLLLNYVHYIYHKTVCKFLPLELPTGQ